MTASETIAAALKDEGCLGRSQDGEPVFVLVARDKYAAAAVRTWAAQVSLLHGHSEKTNDAFDIARQMDVWREAHGGGKIPD